MFLFCGTTTCLIRTCARCCWPPFVVLWTVTHVRVRHVAGAIAKTLRAFVGVWQGFSQAGKQASKRCCLVWLLSKWRVCLVGFDGWLLL